MKYYITQSPANPLARIFAAAVAVICLVGAFFFGLVILAIFAVLIAFGSLVLWLRSWWLGRRLAAQAASNSHAAQDPAWHRAARPAPGSRSQEFIEAEYTVVSERRD